MSLLLFCLTIVLAAVSAACGLIFLYLNNFTDRGELKARNRSLQMVMGITLAASLLLALFAGLLSDAAAADAVNATVRLYFIIAVAMLIVVLASLAALIYRAVSRLPYTGASSGVGRVITVASVGAALGLLLAWLFS